MHFKCVYFFSRNCVATKKKPFFLPAYHY